MRNSPRKISAEVWLEVKKLEYKRFCEASYENASAFDYHLFDVSLFLIQGFSDCKELFKWGINESGLIDVSWQNGSSFPAFCNMEADGGGWLVFQRRNDTTSFYRDWAGFAFGFGDKEGSFWLGLEALHVLTRNKTKNVLLRVDILDDLGKRGYAKYQNFVIGSAAENYSLSYSSYEGDIGDGLARSKGMGFSTFDRDNDMLSDTNCAKKFHSSWWNKDCFDACLNNGHPYGKNEVSIPAGANTMSWLTWDGKYGNVVYSEMMLKAADN